MKALTWMLLLGGLCVGCSARIGEFSVVGRRTAVDAPAAQAVVGAERVTGASCRKTLLFFVPLGPRADLSDAFDAALRASPGADALTEVTVRRKTVMTVVYNEHCFVVEGRPVRLERSAHRPSP